MLLSSRPATTPARRFRWRAAAKQFRGSLKAEVKGRRIAWAGDFKGFTPCEPEVLATCRTALKTFENLGCVVEEAIPDYPLRRSGRPSCACAGGSRAEACSPTTTTRPSGALLS